MIIHVLGFKNSHYVKDLPSMAYHYSLTCLITTVRMCNLHAFRDNRNEHLIPKDVRNKLN